MEFNLALLKHLVKLANLSVTDGEAEQLRSALQDTLTIIDTLSNLDITQLESNLHVSRKTTITRSDTVSIHTSFTQQQALANAVRVHDGYFVVPRIL